MMNIPIFQHESCEKRTNMKAFNFKNKENDTNLFSQDTHTQRTNEKNENFWQSLRKLWSRESNNDTSENDEIHVKTQISALIKEINVCEKNSNKIRNKLDSVEILLNDVEYEEDDLSEIVKKSKEQLKRADEVLHGFPDILSSISNYRKEMNAFSESIDRNIEEIVDSVDESDDYSEIMFEFKRILQKNLEYMSADILEKWNEAMMDIKETMNNKTKKMNEKLKNIVTANVVKSKSSMRKLKRDENKASDDQGKSCVRRSKRLLKQKNDGSIISTPNTGYSYSRLFKTATTTTRTTTTTISTAQKGKRKLQTDTNQTSIKLSPTNDQQMLMIREEKKEVQGIAAESLNSEQVFQKPLNFRSTTESKRFLLGNTSKKPCNEISECSKKTPHVRFSTNCKVANPFKPAPKTPVPNKYANSYLMESEDESVFSLQRLYGV